MAKIIVERKRGKTTQKRVAVALVQDLRAFVKDTELETLSDQKLIDVALRYSLLHYKNGGSTGTEG